MAHFIYAAILAGYLILSSGNPAVSANNQNNRNEMTRSPTPRVVNELE